MSGLGLFEAQINGAKLTDEVLAPGYSNYQLSAEYRTYDVTEQAARRREHDRRRARPGHRAQRQDGQPGRRDRTNSFAWWNSSAVGSGTLLDAAPRRRDQRARLSVASYYVGGTINIDTGDGGERLESRTITAIGTAPSSTALAFPAAAGDTNVKVTSVAGLGVGDTLRFDGGGTATVTAVGTARSTDHALRARRGGRDQRQARLARPASSPATRCGRRRDAHGHRGRHAGSRDDARRGRRRGRDERPRGQRHRPRRRQHDHGRRPDGADRDRRHAGRDGTGLTLAEPLASAAANGAAVRYDGTGVTFTPALAAAHAQNAAVVNSGSGLTSRRRLDRAYASGTADHHAGHGHHLHPGARQRARRRLDRHRLGQPDRRARRERRGAGHAAADRPPRDHLHRRHDRDDRHQPRLARRVRPGGHRPLVRRHRLRRAPRGGRRASDLSATATRRDGSADGLAQRRHRARRRTSPPSSRPAPRSR